MTVGAFKAGDTLRGVMLQERWRDIQKGIFLNFLMMLNSQYLSVSSALNCLSRAVCALHVYVKLNHFSFVCTANGESMELQSVTHTILYLVKTFRFNIFMCIGVMINCKNWFVTRMIRGCNLGGEGRAMQRCEGS